MRMRTRAVRAAPPRGGAAPRTLPRSSSLPGPCHLLQNAAWFKRRGVQVIPGGAGLRMPQARSASEGRSYQRLRSGLVFPECYLRLNQAQIADLFLEELPWRPMLTWNCRLLIL